MDWVIAEFKKDQGIDLSADRVALQRIREAAEKAKIELSSTQSTEINLPFISANASGPIHLQMTLTRSKLEQLTDPLIKRTQEPVQKALEDAKLKASDVEEVVLVGGQTRMPAVQNLVKKLFNGKEPHKGVNPDEVVAAGAAVQAGVLQGDVKDVLLLDVTPLSLGVETKGGVMTVLIPRNTTIPARRSEVFSTAEDGQTQVEIHVVQGERPLASENKSLGRFILDGIPPAPRGTPQIEVTFDIDANGILNVSAKEQSSGKEQRVVIEPVSGLTETEIQRMVREAEQHASEDAQRREEVELRNRADNLAYAAENLLRESGDALPSELKLEIDNQAQAIRQALQRNDMSAIRSGVEALERALQQAESARGEPVGAAAGGGRGGGSGDDETPPGTVEGEFREM
jgi:molecular chaperone DnaK